MKMTLLDMCQNILNAMSSDSVNSISDTEESMMVAEIIRESYYLLMSKRDWPFLNGIEHLQGLADTDNPTKMRMPENINKVFWIKYNKKDVCYMEPKDFLDRIQARVAQAGIIDANGYGLANDPVYWTTFDDDYIIFDSRDETVDNTLVANKTDVSVIREATWTHEDEFIPTLPEKFFPTLLAEAKSTCFVNLKQQPNAKEEGRSRLGQIQMHKEAWRNNKGEHKTNTAVNYGRR